MKHFLLIVACALFALFFAACEGNNNNNNNKDGDTVVVADDNLLADEDGITPTEEEPEGETDVDNKSDPDVPKDDAAPVDDGTVEPDDTVVVTDDDEMSDQSDGSDGSDLTVTDEDDVVTDDIVTDDVVTDDIVVDGDELLNDDDVIVYVNPCAPTNTCVDLNRSVCTDVNLDGMAECACDEDYTLDGGDTCINQKDVSCDTDNANPANSTDVVENVTVNYTDGGGWEDPALCAWECDDTYVKDAFDACVPADGPCADSPCTDANKHVCTDDGSGNPVCSCDEHYNDDDMNDTCEPDIQYVACTNELKENSHWLPSAPYSGDGHVTQTWDGTTFAPAADLCPQECNTDYTLEGGVCINEKQVDCAADPAKPANSHDIIEKVTIFFVGETWGDPDLCKWDCNDGYHWNEDVEACLETLIIEWCNLEAPADSEVAQGESLTVYGRVYIAGVTDLSAEVDTLPQIIGQLSGNPSLGVDAATWPWDGWMDLDPNPDNDSAVGIGDTDEYLVTVPVMSDPGEMDITVRFSGDSGATWTYCNANRLPAYNGTDAENPYDPLKHGRLTVTEGYVDPCALENPCTEENQTVCTDIDLNGVAECACDENYSDDGDGNCVADTRNDQPCTGKLANSVYNTAITITQTWDGDSWEPSTVATYNEEASATECRFKCEDYYYVWDGDSCEDLDECNGSFNLCTINQDSMALCINNSPGNDCGCSEGFELAVFGGVGSLNRTCEDIDECVTLDNPCDTYDTAATCQNTVGDYTCYCSLNYTSDGVTCLPDGPRTENCVDNKPTNSHWVADGNYNGDGTVLQNWTLADGWQPPADECPWACDVDHHVRWDPMFGPFCDPDTQLVACTNTLPENAVWRTEGVYGGGKLTQTWDGDSYEPATDTCPLDCEATYHYENSSEKCVSNTIGRLCTNDLPAGADWVEIAPYDGSGNLLQTWVGPGDDDWTPDTDTCPWECPVDTHYETSSNACAPNIIGRQCTNDLPAGADWVETGVYDGMGNLTQTWVGPGDEDWTPDTDTCPWACTDPLYHENLDLNECLLTYEIDWCNLQSPSVYTGLRGGTVQVTGRLRIDTVTTVSTITTETHAIDPYLPQIQAQLGAGPRNTEPVTWGDQWMDAVPNVDVVNDDEYLAEPILDIPGGLYDYAFRFSGDSGATWTYCDLDGSDNGYQTVNAGRMEIFECLTDTNCTYEAGKGFCVTDDTDPMYRMCVECLVADDCVEGKVCDEPTYTCKLPGKLVVNEVDYDQPSTDTTEYIEVLNVGEMPYLLATVSIEMVNGNGGLSVLYATHDLSVNDQSAAQLLPGQYYVISNPTFAVTVQTACPSCITKTVAGFLIQNADTVPNGNPDGMRIIDNTVFQDGLHYEGVMVGTGEGAAGPLDPGTTGSDNISIGRCPNGADTDDNSADFLVMPSTPGAANTCP